MAKSTTYKVWIHNNPEWSRSSASGEYKGIIETFSCVDRDEARFWIGNLYSVNSRLVELQEMV